MGAATAGRARGVLVTPPRPWLWGMGNGAASSLPSSRWRPRLPCPRPWRSVLLVVIMAAPGLVSKSIETPTLLYSYGKQAGSAFYQSAAAALASTSKVQQDGVAAAADPALAAGAAAGAGADALHGKAAAAGAAAEAAGGHLEVVPGRHDSATPFTLYALAAFALYVAAVVLLALGIEVFVENSVAAVAQVGGRGSMGLSARAALGRGRPTPRGRPRGRPPGARLQPARWGRARALSPC